MHLYGLYELGNEMACLALKEGGDTDKKPASEQSLIQSFNLSLFLELKTQRSPHLRLNIL